jgi:glycine/D-amino acid oxidase-like deaminating enzyme
MSPLRGPVRRESWQPAAAGSRSLWLEQALARDADDHRSPALEGDQRCDICIVGGGFVGLWTALRLAQEAPSARIILLEADICGGGASGRNTGQALPLWSKVKTLKAAVGRDQALWLASQTDRAINDIDEFARSRRADIEFERGGWLWLASSPAQLHGWDGVMETCADVGRQPFEEVGAEEARRRTGSPVYLGGLFMPSAATLHPGRLSRELRRAAIDDGVEIHEGTPVVRLDRATGTAHTPLGSVRASTFVLALGGWAGAVPELRRTIVTVSAEILATEPIPDRLDDSGWTGNEAITNSRLTLRFTRRTNDGRVLFGQAGVRLAFAGRVTSKFHVDPASARSLSPEIKRYVPAAGDAAITHAWAGPVDRSVDGLPVFGELACSQARLLYATGFSGNGVAPALLAARITTSMALDRRDEWSTCGLVDRAVGRFPPEPMRYAGGLAVRAAVARKEDREERGKTASGVVRTLASMAPGGLAAGEDENSSRPSTLSTNTKEVA